MPAGLSKSIGDEEPESPTLLKKTPTGVKGL
jgi:hypothetical protein